MQTKTSPMKTTLKSGNILGVTLLAGILIALMVIAFSSLRASAVDADLSRSSGGWSIEFEETFESGIGPNWTVTDTNGATNGEYYWATTTYTYTEGSHSAWVAGGGADGSGLTAGSNDYPNSALSSMVHDSVDLSSVNAARLTFDYWSETEPQFDLLVVSASTNGSVFNTLVTYDGDSNGWQSKEIDLGALAGESQVWIQFFFSSNATNTAAGAFVDNIRLESATTFLTYMPLVQYTVPPWYYFDDFSDPSSGWPIVDNTHVHNDCFKWYYSSVDTYRADICDDRTDVKVSPLVKLPDGDYEIEVDGRFRVSGGWWTSYGILFDAKDEPDPNKPDLGDYYMVWVLWEGGNKHKWKILKDIPGDQIDLTNWKILDGSKYNYGGNGTAWNTWRIERTDSTISVSVNGNHLRTINESRPTSNYQELFGLFSATYETGKLNVEFDNYLINNGGSSSSVRQGSARGTFVSQPFGSEMELRLPDRGLEIER